MDEVIRRTIASAPNFRTPREFYNRDKNRQNDDRGYKNDRNNDRNDRKDREENSQGGNDNYRRRDDRNYRNGDRSQNSGNNQNWRNNHNGQNNGQNNSRFPPRSPQQQNNNPASGSNAVPQQHQQHNNTIGVIQTNPVPRRQIRFENNEEEEQIRFKKENEEEGRTAFIQSVDMYDKQPTKNYLAGKKQVKKFLKTINVHKTETTEMKVSPLSQSLGLSCSVFGKPFKAYIDTGAEASLVNIGYLMKLVRFTKIDPSLLHFSHWNGGKIKAANGKQLSVFKEVTLPIQRENINVVKGRFVIADHWLPQDILIGPSLLGQLGFSLHDNLKSKTHEFKALPRNPVKTETTHFCGTITHNETKANIPQHQMEINEENPKCPKNADPPKIIILQRPLTENKQQKTKAPAPKQHTGKISTTPPHNRHESSETKFCASGSYREFRRSTPECYDYDSRSWVLSSKLVPLSRIKTTYKNYPHARHKGPTIYEM